MVKPGDAIMDLLPFPSCKICQIKHTAGLQNIVLSLIARLEELDIDECSLTLAAF